MARTVMARSLRNSSVIVAPSATNKIPAHCRSVRRLARGAKAVVHSPRFLGADDCPACTSPAAGLFTGTLPRRLGFTNPAAVLAKQATHSPEDMGLVPKKADPGGKKPNRRQVMNSAGMPPSPPAATPTCPTCRIPHLQVGLFVDLDQPAGNGEADARPMAGIDWAHVLSVVATFAVAIVAIGIILFAM